MGRNQQTPKDRLLNDPEYNNLVRMLESLIEQARFTPSELREACILACINYEMRHVRQHTIPKEVEHSIKILDDFVSGVRR